MSGIPPKPSVASGGRAADSLAGRWLQWLFRPGKGGPPPPTLGQDLPRWFLAFLMLFGMGMILISLIGDQGLIAYYGLRGEAHDLREQVEALQRREVLLLQQIEALRNDPAYIGHLARKRLGLADPDEIVLQLPPPGEPR